MTEYLDCPDGTRIGYDRQGSGPAVILVAAAMQFRGFDPNTVALATALASAGYTVINYDRRGRGDSVVGSGTGSSPGSSSGSGTPTGTVAEGFGLQHEIDDLAALIALAGGSAALFGSSSGGAICLAAAAAGLPVTRLALWETPLGPDGGDDGDAFAAGFRATIDAGGGPASIEYYMKDMPPEWLAGAKNSPAWPVMVQMAPSLIADAEALSWAQSRPRAELWEGIRQPVLALVGAETLPVMTAAAASIEAALPQARTITIAGAHHAWDPEAMAAVLGAFLRE